MNQEKDTRAAKAAVALGYAGLGFLWIWRMVHPSSTRPRTKKPDSWAAKVVGMLESWARDAEEAVGEEPPTPALPVQQAPLPSLSLTTPGDAPLDRVARTAAAEREAEAAGAKPGERIQPFDRKPCAWEPGSALVLEVLAQQRLESPRLEGWHEPRPGKLPVPTFAPAIMAFGIVMFAMGLATTWYICAVGSLIFAVAAWRWAGELQEE